MVIKLFLAFLTGISASLFFDSAFSQEEVAGRAKIISGDTLSIKNIEDGKQFTFRLWGIDAPELDQPCEKKNGQSVDCGVLARNAVRAIIKRSELVCVDFEKDSENQITALCYMGDKILNGAIVRAGWALAYKQESTDFLDVEKQARLNDKGVWEYNFIPPWTWRKNQKK
ncbi:MAG: thermonuclease family protein [Pseudomonadota bacterium]|nr:thermonuclease family protein [Pseudomonadota bacterium]